MAVLQQALGDPEALLGAVTSPEQQGAASHASTAWPSSRLTDWVVDVVSGRVVGGNVLRIAEAARRRRVGEHDETCSSSASSDPPRRRPGRPGQVVRPGCRRTSGRRRAAALLSDPTPSPHRARSHARPLAAPHRRRRPPAPGCGASRRQTLYRPLAILQRAGRAAEPARARAALAIEPPAARSSARTRTSGAGEVVDGARRADHPDHQAPDARG